MLLGVYPAATEVKRTVVEGTPMMLPTAVEERSFAPTSKSGRELDDHYLEPLGLGRDDVLITDLLPYFLANTTVSGSGRSMADNLRAWERSTGKPTGIDARPPPSELVRLARRMPGNVERLREYVSRCRPKLLFTLGAEAAAFVRRDEHEVVAARVDAMFYAPPEEREVLGHEVDVVHLVHPHLFIKKNARCMTRHTEWCERDGRRVVEEALGVAC